MEDQQDGLRIWREHKGARCKVPGFEMIPREAIGALLQEREHVSAEFLLLRIRWVVFMEQLSEMGVSRHDLDLSVEPRCCDPLVMEGV